MIRNDGTFHYHDNFSVRADPMPSVGLAIIFSLPFIIVGLGVLLWNH